MSSSAMLKELQKKKRELKKELQSMEGTEEALGESVMIVEEELEIQELKERIEAKRVVMEQLESMKRDLEKIEPKTQ